VIRDIEGGIELLVRVIPRAKRTELAGTRDGHLLIRLAAPPVEGAANEALVEFLSRRLNCPRRAIHILSGHSSRTKRIKVQGLSAQAAQGRLQA
jgi:uncharacterized protein (TIGR00251 family)